MADEDEDEEEEEGEDEEPKIVCTTYKTFIAKNIFM